MPGPESDGCPKGAPVVPPAAAAAAEGEGGEGAAAEAGRCCLPLALAQKLVVGEPAEWLAT